MKKVLSVLLAAAMVAGMSVTSFAADYVWASNANDEVENLHACDLFFDNRMIVVHNDENMDHFNEEDWVRVERAYEDMKPGDNLYFQISNNNYVDELKCDLLKAHAHSVEKCGTRYACEEEEGHTHVKGECAEEYNCDAHNHTEECYEVVAKAGHYYGAIDKDWSINIKGNENIANAYFVAWTGTEFSTKASTLGNEDYQKFICVEIIDDLDNLTAQDAEMYMYIADMDRDCDCDYCESGHIASKCESADIYMKYSFDNLTATVDFKFTNDADKTAKWAVAKNTKGTAVFDFDDDVYFTVKMVSEEKVILNMSTAYDKAIDALFGYDADLSFYNFEGTKDSFTKTGELFLPAAEETFVYEIVDGEIVEIEAEYVEEYKVANTSKAKAGWVIETNELGYYIVSDIEAEIEVEAEVEAEPEVEAEKANPETGAADFVGAAVAMAVVSVAAAGALALKK